MTPSISIGNQVVPITGCQETEWRAIAEFVPFKDWCVSFANQQSNMRVHGIEVQSIDRFGARIGFLKFKAHVEMEGSTIPGIVFMRGGSVSVLIILRSHGEPDKVLLTLQPRLAVPSSSFPELPAGLTIREDELQDMTELAYKDRWRGVYPSAGGSDEFLRLFLSIKTLTPERVQELEGRLTGLRDQGERITLSLVNLDDAWQHAPDAKLLSSLMLYRALRAQGRL